MRSELPDGWTSKRFGDLVAIEHGYAFRSEYFCEADDGVPVVVSVGNFEYSGGFRFDSTATKGYSGDFPDRFRLRPGEILLVMTCQTQGGEILGIPGRIPNDGRTYLHNQRLGRVVFRGADQLDPNFAYWVFLGPVFNRALCRTATGSKILHTAPTRIEAYELALPPFAEQGRIASVLGALNNKIDSNRRLAGLLEEAAATVFRARFVDFVGVEEFEDTDIGRIPRGWRAGSLSDIAELTMGQSPPGSSYSSEPEGALLLVQGMGGFGTRYPTSQIYTSAPTKRARPGATLMTVRAPVGAVNIARTEVCLGRGVAGIDSDWPAFTEFLIRSLRSRWASEESGTIFPAVNRGQVLGLSIVEPPRAEIVRFEEFAAPLVRKVAAQHDETESLVAIRDALLPKLVSGKIRVPDTHDPDEVIGLVAEGLSAVTS